MESWWEWYPEIIQHLLYGVCQQLAKRKADKIVSDNFKAHQVYLASIDCIHFEWDECQTDPGGYWYSHKHNDPGISYEVSVDTVKEMIVWTNGHFHTTHDITFFVVAKRKMARINGNNPVCITKFLRAVGWLETPDILAKQTKSLPLFWGIHQKQRLFC